MTSSEPSPRTYTGWQPEKVAFFLGFSGQRSALLAVAVLAAVWPLTAVRWSAALLTWPIAFVLALLGLVRVGGRTLDEWLVAVASYGLIRLRGQHRFLSGPFAPYARTTLPGRIPPPDLPGILAPLAVLEVQMPGGGPLAVAHHPRDRTYTAVARIRFPGLGLIDSVRSQQRVAGWGSLLAGLCVEGHPIVRVQALQRLLPESGAALRRWHTDHHFPAAPALAAEVTTGLLATPTLATSRREAYLAFTLDAKRAAREIRAAGGGSAGATNVLTRHLRALAGPLAAADLQVEVWLGARDLAEVLRTAFDPDSARPLAERRAAATGRYLLAPGHNPATGDGRGSALPAGVDPGLAGPAAADTTPGTYRHDGGQSVTFWVAGWPRSHIYASALAPLLGEGAHRRAVSLHFSPLGPRSAERQVMRERTERSVAVSMRRRSGQVVPEHEALALDRARGQDAERAAGHGLVRFTAYVTVTTTTAEDLDDACAALEADGAAAGIELRRMWFAQDIGFAMSCLPLGFGLPRKRW
jgi:hypothetical protein